MANTLSVMTNVLRNAVSKQRIRYKDNKYNLDLTYINEDIIAMGYPADNLESIYRNRLEDVYKFFEENHQGHYKIYNLCLERSYDINKFHGRVAVYPFEDHNPPTMELIQKFCFDIDSWLKSHTHNVAAVHCKAGKGRTGTMICCYLLYSRQFQTADAALAFYDEKRTKDRKGVTIPSQRRYVQYFSKLIRSSLTYEKKTLQFCEIRFIESNLLCNQGAVHCSISVLLDTSCNVKTLQNVAIDFRRTCNVDLRNASLFVTGDTKIELTHKTSRKKLFHFWFNTFFVCYSATVEDGNDDVKLVYTLNKNEIDDAHKDKEHKSFSEDFKVQLVFYDNSTNAIGADKSNFLQNNYTLQQNSSSGSDLNLIYDQKSSSSASVCSLGGNISSIAENCNFDDCKQYYKGGFINRQSNEFAGNTNYLVENSSSLCFNVNPMSQYKNFSTAITEYAGIQKNEFPSYYSNSIQQQNLVENATNRCILQIQPKLQEQYQHHQHQHQHQPQHTSIRTVSCRRDNNCNNSNSSNSNSISSKTTGLSNCISTCHNIQIPIFPNCHKPITSDGSISSNTSQIVSDRGAEEQNCYSSESSEKTNVNHALKLTIQNPSSSSSRLAHEENNLLYNNISNEGKINNSDNVYKMKKMYSNLPNEILPAPSSTTSINKQCNILPVENISLHPSNNAANSSKLHPVRYHQQQQSLALPTAQTNCHKLVQLLLQTKMGAQTQDHLFKRKFIKSAYALDALSLPEINENLNTSISQIDGKITHSGNVDSGGISTDGIGFGSSNNNSGPSCSGLSSNSKQKLKIKIKKKKEKFQWFQRYFRSDPIEFCDNFVNQTTAMRRNSISSLSNRNHTMSSTTLSSLPHSSPMPSLNSQSDEKCFEHENKKSIDSQQFSSTTRLNEAIMTALSSSEQNSRDFYSSICDNQLSFKNSNCTSPSSQSSIISSKPVETYNHRLTPNGRPLLLFNNSVYSSQSNSKHDENGQTNIDPSPRNNVIFVTAKPANKDAIGFNVENHNDISSEATIANTELSFSNSNKKHIHKEIKKNQEDITTLGTSQCSLTSKFLKPKENNNAQHQQPVTTPFLFSDIENEISRISLGNDTFPRKLYNQKSSEKFQNTKYNSGVLVNVGNIIENNEDIENDEGNCHNCNPFAMDSHRNTSKIPLIPDTDTRIVGELEIGVEVKTGGSMVILDVSHCKHNIETESTSLVKQVVHNNKN